MEEEVDYVFELVFMGVYAFVATQGYYWFLYFLSKYTLRELGLPEDFETDDEEEGTWEHETISVADVL